MTVERATSCPQCGHFLTHPPRPEEWVEKAYADRLGYALWKCQVKLGEIDPPPNRSDFGSDTEFDQACHKYWWGDEVGRRRWESEAQ